MITVIIALTYTITMSQFYLLMIKFYFGVLHNYWSLFFILADVCDLLHLMVYGSFFHISYRITLDTLYISMEVLWRAIYFSIITSGSLTLTNYASASVTAQICWLTRFSYRKSNLSFQQLELDQRKGQESDFITLYDVVSDCNYWKWCFCCVFYVFKITLNSCSH